MPRFILYGGKGGVGKTSCAAATALNLASDGNRTLLVSTDPAHSLSDSLDLAIGPEETRVEENLWAVEIDPEQALNQFQNEMDTAGGMGMGGMGDMAGGNPLDALGTGPGDDDPLGLGDDLGGDLLTGAAAPGMDEAAAMDRFMRYMESDYDYVVFDTAPTGHTLRLLELPEFLDSMVGRVMKIRMRLGGFMDNLKNMFGGAEDEPGEDDLQQLEETKARIERARALLRDPEKTDFRVVTIPESMAVRESDRLVKRLEDFRIPVRTVVLNKVLRDGDCDFCTSRAEAQWNQLKKAHELFRGLHTVEIPLYPHEVQGRDALEKMSHNLTE